MTTRPAALYLLLRSHADEEGEVESLDRGDIAVRLGASDAAVSQALVTLIRCGAAARLEERSEIGRLGRLRLGPPPAETDAPQPKAHHLRFTFVDNGQIAKGLRERYGIEVVTRFVADNVTGSTSRHVPLSLPRVRFLEGGAV